MAGKFVDHLVLILLPLLLRICSFLSLAARSCRLLLYLQERLSGFELFEAFGFLGVAGRPAHFHLVADEFGAPLLGFVPFPMLGRHNPKNSALLALNLNFFFFIWLDWRLHRSQLN